jgi:hypothetical protein
MGGRETGSEDELNEKMRESLPATENKPPYERKHAEDHEQTAKKPGHPALRRALVPSLYMAGTGVLLYAAWRWLKPKHASKESKPTWTLNDTLGPYD